MGQNEYFYGGLAAGAIGIDMVSDGWLRRKFLYSQSKTQAERERRIAGDKRVVEIIERRPQLRELIEKNYRTLCERASLHAGAPGGKYELIEGDLNELARGDFQKALAGVTDNANKGQVVQEASEVIAFFGEELKIKEAGEVTQYFSELGYTLLDPGKH